MPPTAFTAKRATSKTRRKTSLGFAPKAQADRITAGCREKVSSENKQGGNGEFPPFSSLSAAVYNGIEGGIGRLKSRGRRTWNCDHLYESIFVCILVNKNIFSFVIKINIKKNYLRLSHMV